jgi:AraC-like DNA-binding protein
VRPWYVERPSVGGPLQCTWTASVGGAERRLIPDACLDLLWIDTGRLVLCGPETTAWTFALPPGVTAVGVRFRPGAAGSVLGVDVSELREVRVPVADLWGDGPARRLSEQLADAASPSARVTLLEDVVHRRAADAEPDPVAAEVAALLGTAASPELAAPPAGSGRRGCQLLPALPVEGRVAALAGVVGLSERQLLRRCTTAFGYGPTTLARILRLQRFLALARRHGTAVPLARLAFAAGYADQPHLSREVRAIAGVTAADVVSDPFKTPAPPAAMMRP